MSTRRNRGKNMDLTGTECCGVCGYLLTKQLNECCGIVEEANTKIEALEETEALVEEEDEVILEEEALEEVVEEEESDDDEDLEAYLEELPVKELKKLCDEADLSKKGKKADLVARLLE